jgi:hypothetical protein
VSGKMKEICLSLFLLHPQKKEINKIFFLNIFCQIRRITLLCSKTLYVLAKKHKRSCEFNKWQEFALAFFREALEKMAQLKILMIIGLAQEFRPL